MTHHYLEKNKGKWEGEGDVSKRLRNRPYFVSSSRSWYSLNAAFYFSIFCKIKYIRGHFKLDIVVSVFGYCYNQGTYYFGQAKC